MKNPEKANPLITDWENTSDNFVKLNLDKPEIEKLMIIKKKGTPFKKDDKIAKYLLKGKDNLFYIKSPIYGWIVKYEEDDKTLILEKCKHEIFYFRLCTKCGYEKTEEYGEERKAYGFMDNDFYISKEKAESLEKSKVDDYLTSKKLILLLDLDNTILHCSSIQLTSEQIKFLSSKYSLYSAKIPIKNEINRFDNIFIKFRPYLKTFLKNIKNKFEIFVYTQATKEYATGVIQYINKNFEEDILSTRRMIPRIMNENGFAKNKSIKNVFPTQEKMVLIIDDNAEVWKESGNNLLCIYPYRFFSEKDKNSKELVYFIGSEKKYTKDYFLTIEFDNVLFCITNLLINIHRQFFDYYEKNKFTKSISRIINDTLKFILFKKKFYYHLNFDKPDLYPQKNKKRVKKEKINKDNNNNEDNKNEHEELNIKKNDNNLEGNDIKKELDDNKAIDENQNDKEEIKKITIDDKTRKSIKEALKNKIEKLGGVYIEEEKDKFTADYFLTDFYDDNDPIIKSIENYKEKKIPILHCHYIEICHMYYFSVKVEDFILSDKNKFLKFLDLNQIFEKNKVDIINYYENNEFVDEN